MAKLGHIIFPDRFDILVMLPFAMPKIGASPTVTLVFSTIFANR